MISILIPVYNRDVTSLVTDLHVQATASGIAFELLVADDASENERSAAANARLEGLPGVRYFFFPQNRGAGTTRQALAAQARYSNLLLIDSDARIVGNSYFARFTAYADGKTAVFGGIAYAPESRRENLRWWYGVNRECVPADEKGNRPNGFLTTFNLLLPKDVFLREAGQLSGYGHEDTLLGMQLERDGVRVAHINNPLLHTGLPDNETFLLQTDSAVRNLLTLYRSFEPLSLLRKRSRLIRLLDRLRSLGLLRVYAAWFALSERRLRKRLLSGRPSLRDMDLYKLGKLVAYYLQ